MVLADSSETASGQAREVFSGLDCISRVEASPQGFVLISPNADSVIPRLVRAATERGLGIDSVTLKRPTLEDVFLDHTGRALREEEGGSDAFRRMARGVRQARR